MKPEKEVGREEEKLWDRSGRQGEKDGEEKSKIRIWMLPKEKLKSNNKRLKVFF